MSKLLGVIKAVIGQVYVTEPDGSQRLLKTGDRIYSGEEIVTGNSGAVSVSLPNGQTVDIGRNSHWGDQGLHITDSHSAQVTQEVADLQQAIADGADPTQTLEATAAGNQASEQVVGGSGGGHTLVQLELTGQVVDPTAGFNTQGLAQSAGALNEPQSALSGAPAVRAPEVQITGFAGNDGFINNNEINQTVLTGTSNQTHISLTFTDSQKNTFSVDVPVTHGNWTYQADLHNLVPGGVTVTATATDVTGRTAISTDTAIVDTTGPQTTLSIDNVTPDNIINIAESHSTMTVVQGQVGGEAKAGDIVTLTVNGHDYYGAASDPGNGTLVFHIAVPTQDLITHPDISGIVTSTDPAGNTTVSSTTHHVDSDLFVQNGIAIQTIANDDVVNLNESRMPTLIAADVSGEDARVGDPVTLVIQGQTFHGAVVSDNGQLRYNVFVPSTVLKEGANGVEVTLTSHDAAGNEAVAVSHHIVTLDTHAENTLSVTSVTADNTLNHTELFNTTQLITGLVSGEDAKAGDPVSLEIKGQQFTGEVVALDNGQLGYRIAVDSSLFGNNASNIKTDVNVTATVTSHDAAGNEAIATTTHVVHVDNFAENSITLGTVAGDNVINIVESTASNGVTTITGTVAGPDAKAGDLVELSLKGVGTLQGHVVALPGGELGYSIPVNTHLLMTHPEIQVSVISTDAAGNTVVSTDQRTINVDMHTESHITVDTVTADNVINIAESHQPQTAISGVVSGDAKLNDTVHLQVNGQDYHGLVIQLASGNLGYSIPVNTADIVADPHIHASITTTDSAGNQMTATSEHQVGLDLSAGAGIGVNTVSGDDVINLVESQQGTTTLTGPVTGDAKLNDTVTLTFNGQHYSGTVTTLADGSLGYSIPVSTANLTDGSIQTVHVAINTLDDHGNPFTATRDHNVVIDLHAQTTISTDDVTADNTLNHTELFNTTRLISGVVGEDAKAGDPVSLEIKGQQFTGEVVALDNGQLGYQIAVDASLFGNNASNIKTDVNVTATVTSHDAAGNEAIATTTHVVHVDNFAENSITLGTVAGDNVINIVESTASNGVTTITGTVAGPDAKAGDLVELSLKGVGTLQGQVVALPGGGLGYSIPVNTHLLMTHPEIQVSVTSKDAAGNTVVSTDQRTIDVDMHTESHITVDTVTADNVINIAESHLSQTAISGVVSGDAKLNDTVHLQVNGQDYHGLVSQLASGNLGYSIPVNTADIVADPHIHASITTTDSAGNQMTATSEHQVGLDLSAGAGIGVNTVSGDDVINLVESQQGTTTLTGPVTGDAKLNDTVTLTFNGQSYQGHVIAVPGGLGYSIPVSTANLTDGSTQTVHVAINTLDDHGNPFTATRDHNVVIDLHAQTTISTDDVTADNTLNHTELFNTTRLISGVMGEDAKAGDPVSLEIKGQQFTGEVVALDNGQLGYRIAVDASLFGNNASNIKTDVNVTATVTSHDAAGNEAIATTTHVVHVDNFAENSITLGTVAGDNVINIVESTASHGVTTITGTVSGPDAKAGDLVELSLKGIGTLQGQVIAVPGGLGYSIPVNTHLLMTHPEIQVSVTSTDAAGNTVVSTDQRTIDVDMHTESHITVDTVTADNVINIAESHLSQTAISGVVSGDAKLSDTVHLQVNGQDYHGSVIRLASGNLGYSIPVNTADIVADPHIHASITTTDSAGNQMTATSEHQVGLDLDAGASIGVNTVSGDDVINLVESQQGTTTLTGPVTGDAKLNDTVTLTFNGQHYSGTVTTLADGSLGYSIPVSTANLTDGSIQTVHVAINTLDDHGNPFTATQDHNVVIDLHAENAINVDSVTGDNTLNHTELFNTTQLITGLVSGEDAKAGDPVSLEIKGQQFTGEVVALDNGQLGYRIAVDASLFGNNASPLKTDVNVTATVTSHDAAGNEAIATTTHVVHVDNFAENSITLGTVAGDNVINIVESTASNGVTTITGTVAGPDAKVGDRVELSLKGIGTLQGQVIAVPGGLGYSIPVNTHLLMTHPEIQVSVTSTDAAGNTVVSTDQRTVGVDMHTESHITISTVTADNVINIDEAAKSHTSVVGVVSGDAKLHDTVHLQVNGHDYHGSVIQLASGNLGYSISVNTADLLADQHIHASITTTDSAGNVMTVTSEHQVGLDLDASASIGVDTVAGDDVINQAESQLKTTTVTGPVGGDAQIGDPITLTLKGTTYHGSVTMLADGTLGYSIPVNTDNLPDGSNQTIHVSLTTTDAHDNHVTVEMDHQIHVDLHADATITVGSVTADNVLNFNELNTPMQLIQGTVGGDARLGDTVIVTVQGHEFNGKVIDLGNNQLGYQIPVDSSAFSANATHVDKNVTFTAKVTSHDDAGNVTTQTATHVVHIDNHAGATITLDTLAGDNMLNQAESRLRTTQVMGTVGGDVHRGDKVEVTVNNKVYIATVAPLAEHNGALGYKLDVLTQDIIKDPHISAHVVGVDSAGNVQKADVTQAMTVDLHAKAMITIDPVTGDNRVNNAEAQQAFTTVTGHVAGDVHVNDTVYLTVNNHTLTGKVVDQGQGVLGYSIRVSTADLLADPHLVATVSTQDIAGNRADAQAETTAIIDTRVDAAITIDHVTPDNVLNLAEQMQGHTQVSGTVTGEVHPGDPLVLTVNGTPYKGVVEDQGNGKMGYHISVATADITANPHIVVAMDVTDAAQNTAHITAQTTVGLDDHADVALTIGTVTGDDVLNRVELQQANTTVTGTVGGDAKAGDTVHLTIDGHEVDARVVDIPGLGTLGYTTEVPTAWLNAGQNITATIAVTDAAGNSTSQTVNHAISVDPNAVAQIQIDPLHTADGDSVINFKEAHSPTTAVSGTVGSDVHAGDTVELTINGQTYYTRVDNNLSFSTQVTTLDLLASPTIHASVTGKDAAGNIEVAHDDRPVEIDTTASAGIHIDSIDPEKPSGPDFYILKGHVSGDAIPGDTVIVNANGHQYPTQVVTLPDGTLGYERTLSMDDLRANPNVTVTIHTTDNHGNPAVATDHLLVPNVPGSTWVPPVDHGNGGGTTTPPLPHVHLTVAPVAGDNVINQSEATHRIPVRGTVSGNVHEGDDVVVTVAGQQYHGSVTAIPGLPGELSYQVDVPASVLVAHPQFDVSVSVTTAGGTATASLPVTVGVDTQNPVQITLDKVAGDNVINAAEAQSGNTTLSGTVSGEGINAGSIVTLAVNGHQLAAVVQDDGQRHLTWSRAVSVNDLRMDPDFTATVEGTDAAGNTGSASQHGHVDVDLKADAGVTIDNLTSDDVLNAVEAGQPTTRLTGSVSGDVHPNDTVTLSVNGHTLQTTVDQHGHYAVDVNTQDLIAGKSITASVTGQDIHGNLQDASVTHGVRVDTQATAGITLNTVGGDNVLNASEVATATTEVSGRVTGDVHKGDTVYVTVNNHTVNATVVELPHLNGALGYSVQVNTADIVADPDIKVSVTGHDAAGNTLQASADLPIAIDTHADATISLDKVSDDDVLNDAQTRIAKTTLSGHVTGDVETGDSVTVTVNGHDLNTKVVTLQDGSKGFHVEASTVDLVHDQHITATVTAHDDAGNRQDVSDSKTLIIDRVATGTVDIASVTDDNVLNKAELSQATTIITGHVGGDARANDPVTLKVGNHTYAGQVIVLPNNSLGYQIAVATTVLQANHAITATLTGHDAPGNPFNATHTLNYTIDDRAVGDITLAGPVAGDNVVNLAESAQDTLITGVLSGDALVTDHVILSVNGQQITATVSADSQGVLHYQAAVPTASLVEGINHLVVSDRVTDTAGNTLDVSTRTDITLDTHANTALTIEPHLAGGDNVVNAAEAQAAVLVTGAASGDAREGDTVNVDIGGQTFSARLDDQHHYSVAVDSSVLQEGANTGTVSIVSHDAAGNTATDTQSLTLTKDTHVDASLVIDPVSGDNHISGRERGEPTTHITGRITGEALEHDAVEVTINGHHYTGEVHEDLNGLLRYDIEADTTAFHRGHNQVSVGVDAHDASGNSAPQVQTTSVVMDSPHSSHHPDPFAGSGHHGAHDGLNHLFGGHDEVLSFHYGNAAPAGQSGPGGHHHNDHVTSQHEKVDLSDLAHELHEGTDITQYIKPADSHTASADQGASSVAPPAPAAHAPTGHDGHAMSVYSLDHLIGKPDHFNH